MNYDDLKKHLGHEMRCDMFGHDEECVVFCNNCHELIYSVRKSRREDIDTVDNQRQPTTPDIGQVSEE